MTTSRRTFLSLAGAGALAACGTSGPKSTSGATGAGDGATYWYLTGQPQQGIRADQVKRFNDANPGAKLATTEFQNDAFKQKIKTAIGAGQGPTLIWGWGGGGLKSYVDAGQVAELTGFFAENAALKESIFPSAFGAATVGGKIYAMPVETTTPIVLFYDKRAFEKIGAQPPQSWGDILDLVPKFNGAGIAPFSLGGQSRWTNMMWLEFLFDRIGGSSVFQAIFEQTPGSWSDPAALKALGELQNLIKAGGFIKGFSSITADSNADQALLFTGKAAMMLHGSWTYGNMKSSGGDFVTGGHLGYLNFPGVDGGKGDPTDTVGNPGQYLSISSKASAADQETARKFLATGTLDDASVDAWVASGNIAVAKSAKDKLAAITDQHDSAWLNFVYNTAAGAKNFTQSWDQALSPTQAETLLDNIAKLFQLSIAPQQFADAMNAVIGK
ncbi:extracellular solute-binding protein [Kribbella sandramycini]|uniref:Extracellular solute-binding protein n=1 Tax=Kribbella sandramycini TaxID=60450 RepID=A0A7Y4KWX7_9ACTN|nr:extracellular solute-binding protein [Kribbella sandramycini]MBB6569999.1 raffinose/stachyose/melibiose transport system substrate-binding protein [Kribbella sandramycini]NOL40177.1 extracellular solute-binding protein [Kribbella sandramycini]